MQTHKVVFVLLFAGGLLTSSLILPRKQELALMRLQAGQLEQAEALYEDIYRENQLGRSNLIPLTRVYLAQGEVEKAIRVYEIYLKENPDDLVVLEHVARIYRDTQRYYDYMSALEKIVAKKPSTEYLQELVRYQLYYGQVDKAILTLKQLVKNNPERQKEFLQLIRLQAHSGDYTGAERSLEQFIQSGHRPNQALAELKLRLLLSAERNQDAFEWAKIWLDRHQDDALHYIAMLYSGGSSSGVETAFETSSRIDPDIMPSWLVKAVVSTGWAENKTGFLEQFTARLAEDKQKEFPVIMAKLALIRKDTDSLDHWLAVSEQLSDLDASQQMSLAGVYLESGRTGDALSLLSDLIDNPNVPIALFSQAASAILESGDIEKGLGLYRQLKNKHEDRRIQFAWALLASANGQKEVADWLGTGQGSELPRLQWRDIYFAAADRGHNELALDIARRIYTRFGEEVDLRSLAESLLKANLASEALDLVRPRRADSPLLGQLYEQALEVAWRQDSRLVREVVSLWKRHLESPDLSREERRDIAFRLLKAGEKETAAEEFRQLAEAEGPNGEDVKQLLFIWGPLPGGAVLDWLEKRAEKAPATDLAGWWEHLIQAGGAERVLSMVAKTSVDLTPEAEKVLMSALTAAGDSSGIDRQLRAQAERTLDVKRLEKLAAQAHREGLAEAEAFIWHRLMKVDPDNLRAQRGIGLAAYLRGDRHACEKFLTRYLERSRDDWESTFYLAEVMYADGRRGKAKPVYERSLAELKKVLKPSKQQRIARALMYYRLGRTGEAMEAYDALVRQYPDDAELIADYSILLIDEGQLEKARRLLGKDNENENAFLPINRVMSES